MIARRRLVALVSTLLMIAIGAGVIGALAGATQSEGGRDWLRRALQAQLARSVQGRVHLGTLSGSFLTDLIIDSLEIRDPDDSLFLATGPMRITFDPRDLIDGRIILRSLDIDGLFFAEREASEGGWTDQRVFPRRGGTRRVRRPRSAFGSVLVIEDARIANGQFVLVQPWTPPDSLRGARRDSAIVAALADTTMEVRRAGPDRYVRTRRWLDLHLEVPRARLAYPDSVGRLFDVARLDANETDPPFAIRGLAGQVRWVGDSIWLDVPRFELPGSTGRGEGKIVWGSGLPTRYALRIRSDSVALADVAWIDPSIPTEGTGRMVLDIRNQRGDLDVIEYAISEMDLRTHRSRLRGRMTWGVGGPVVQLRDVDLDASPLDFALLERFNLGPFPFPFAGRFTGRVRARGGPLHRFLVDDLALTFHDANVPGAVSRARGRGELDILSPGDATFRGFDLELGALDLRTIRFLNPEFPRLGGTLAGTTRLDSIWTDVRFGDADVTHHDEDAPVSRLRGAGRLTSRGEFVTYELDAVTLPLSFTTLARSYPVVPLRGEFRGPLRVRGSLEDLFVVADLVGDAGRVETDMRIDATAPRYRVIGRAALSGANPRAMLDDARAPVGELTARLALDVAGDSLADLAGTLQIDLDRSVFDGVRVFAGMGRVRFADGRAALDTLHVESSALELSAAGGLGLHAGRDDSLQVRAVVDSLGGFRRWLATVEDDTLAGRATLDATLHGWWRGFALGGGIEGEGLVWRGSTARYANARADLAGLPAFPSGVVTFAGDTLRAFGLGFGRVRATTRFTDGVADLRIDASGSGGAIVGASARIARAEDSLRVRLDSLAVTTDSSRWRLVAPALFARGDSSVRLDSLVLRSGRDAVVRIAGESPRQGSLGLSLRARGLPLADLSELLQREDATGGTVDLDAELRGTAARPEIEGSATLRQALVSGFRLDTLRLSGRMMADQLQVTALLGPLGRPNLHAEALLPLRFRLDGTPTEWIADGALRGRLRADSLGFETFEAWSRAGNGARGTVDFDVTLGGTWRRPTFDGRLRARNGTLAFAPLGDIRWRNVRADVAFLGDSVVIDSISATSSLEGRTGRASVSGWISLRDRLDPRLDLRLGARGFHAYGRPDVADVDLTGALRLDGSWRDAVLRGELTADRAVIAIPTLASKDVISLEDPDQLGVVDTVALLDQRRIPGGPPTLIENLTVQNVPIRMGREVWLRSSEANINLGGFVNITRGRVTRGRDAGRYQLALDGPLRTERGTFRLNLGPVQRSFEVEQGEIRFFGDPDNNPTLDISAMHVVRQYSQQGVRPDVRVRVHIGGTLASPTAELSTPDSVRVTNADLVSYLVTGGPSFEIAGRGGDYTSTAARVLISSVGSFLGGKATGGLCDDAQVSTAGVDEIGGGLRDVSGSILSGTRFTCAKQLTDRTFVRLDAGLCQVGQMVTQGSSSPLNLEAFGVKIDYLLGRDLTASAGVEPPTSAVLCARNASARGFVPTPQQIGFDLFRSWRF